MKDNLKMSQSDRDNVHIIKIFPAKKPNSNIYYVQCETQDDVSLITSHVSNLSNTNFDKNGPQIVTHIPNILYRRYQYCQKMLFKLKMSKPQMLQTNIRLGRSDLLVRYKQKGDDTPWRDVPLIIIPQDAPRPEMNLLKDHQSPNTSINEPTANPITSHQNLNNTIPTSNTKTPPTFIQTIYPLNTTQSSPYSTTSSLSESSGSVSQHLIGKHNLSDTTNDTIQTKKTDIYLHHP